MAVKSKSETATSGDTQDSTPAPAETAPRQKVLPPGFLDFRGLLAVLPLGERTTREEIKRGRIPSIRLPHGRRLLFHWPSVEKALLRFQRGGLE